MNCTVIQNAVVFTVDSKDTVFRNGTVVLRGDRIAAVGATEEIPLPADATQVIDGQGRMVVLPGLIDAHSHSSLLRGVTENMQLLDWLPRYQLEHRAVNEEDAYHAALLCYLEALKGGTTCVMDMYRFMHRCAEAAGVLGLRVNLVPYLADLPGKDFFETMAANRQLIETHHQTQGGRVRVWIGLEHLFYCSPQAYQQARTYADAYQVGIHTHSSEQQEEVEAVVQQFGQRPIQVFYERGILGPATAIAHCVWLSDDEIQLLADTGTAVAHCPTSNAKLAGGVARVVDMKQAGITVGLGTDGFVCNNNLDLFEEMKFASLLQKVTRYEAAALAAPEVLRMATIEGAKLLGLEAEIGSLEVGKKADVVLLNLWQPHLLPVVWEEKNSNIVWNLVYSARASDVDTVFVDGVMVVQGGKSTRISELEVMNGAQSQVMEHLQRREQFKSMLMPIMG